MFYPVVMSALGFPKQVEEPMTRFTDSMEAVLRAMETSGVDRVVTMSAWYTDPATRKGETEPPLLLLLSLCL